jgi:hypothetical protein
VRRLSLIQGESQPARSATAVPGDPFAAELQQRALVGFLASVPWRSALL